MRFSGGGGMQDGMQDGINYRISLFLQVVYAHVLLIANQPHSPATRPEEAFCRSSVLPANKHQRLAGRRKHSAGAASCRQTNISVLPALCRLGKLGRRKPPSPGPPAA